MKGIVVKPIPSPKEAFPSYPVSAAFGPHAVHLSRKQRAWLMRVLHSRTYGPRRADLRFAIIPKRYILPGYSVPLVIYVASGDIPDRGGHVIGESCNALFDPQEHGLFPGSEVSCEGATPLPVVP
jgi:hypothetical protein